MGCRRRPRLDERQFTATEPGSRRIHRRLARELSLDQPTKIILHLPEAQAFTPEAQEIGPAITRYSRRCRDSRCCTRLSSFSRAMRGPGRTEPTVDRTCSDPRRGRRTFLTEFDGRQGSFCAGNRYCDTGATKLGEALMPTRVKEPSTKPPREDQLAPSRRQAKPSRQLEEQVIDLCTDNDLGAEWPPNRDCIEKSRKKFSRGPKDRR